MNTTEIVSDTIPMVVSQPQADVMRFDSSNSANVVHSICEFLSKPRLRANLTWVPGDPANTLLTTFDSYLTPVDTYFLDKIRGFRGLSYTTHVKVILNATPFMSGCLKLSYMPNGRALASRGNSQISVGRMSSSQLPSVYCTTLDQGMEMTIPHISAFNYRIDELTDPARIYLQVS